VTPLHITNGDHAADKLRSFVDGPITLACDVLHEGPCPPVHGDAWHDVRGRFLSGPGRPADAVKASLKAADRTILDACARGATTPAGGDLVLWFEHDLFDQLEVIRTLDLVATLKPRASLICIDRFPGVARFIGLGQLTVEQLATLEGTGVPVTAGHFGLAIDAWRAFRSPDPAELLDLTLGLSAARTAVSEGGPALPFLGDALLRFLAEYPSAANGLSRTEELALQALLDRPLTAGALFRVTQADEPQPFMGDLTFFDIVRRLASGRVPLVTVAAGPDQAVFHSRLVSVTDAGRAVLGGRADHVRLNGIDLWRGGVHLAGSDSSPWRWDAQSESLVS
jgi:hypothetical protein